MFGIKRQMEELRRRVEALEALNRKEKERDPAAEKWERGVGNILGYEPGGRG